MNKLNVSVALLAIFAATTAIAEDAPATTLQSANGTVVLTGVLRAADAETYTIETAVGLVTVKKAASLCSGYCPTDVMSALPIASESGKTGQDS